MQRDTKALTSYFSEVCDSYISEQIASGDLMTATIKSYKAGIKHFLFYLEECGHTTFRTVDKPCVSAFIPWVAKRLPGGLHTALPAVRSFLRFLNTCEVFQQDWILSLRVVLAQKRKIQPGFTQEEIDRILSATHTVPMCGRRDYAILMLAANTGLRSTDILHLRLDDLDWRKNEIRILQHKTGYELTLPLLPDVGNAIANYILHERPASDYRNIFLSTRWPHHGLSNQGVCNIVVRAANASNVDSEKTKQHGIRSFRRSVGLRMLEAEIPLDLIREVLGHRFPDSIKPYLAIDHTHLRWCALTLDGIKTTRRELQ
jgi:site-specific recombinase XerD